MRTTFVVLLSAGAGICDACGRVAGVLPCAPPAPGAPGACICIAVRPGGIFGLEPHSNGGRNAEQDAIYQSSVKTRFCTCLHMTAAALRILNPYHSRVMWSQQRR